jgi:hypothetical protein
VGSGGHRDAAICGRSGDQPLDEMILLVIVVRGMGDSATIGRRLQAWAPDLALRRWHPRSAEMLPHKTAEAWPSGRK